MTRIIDTRAELESLPPGSLLIERDGQPMTRTTAGEFALFSFHESRWVFYSVTELDGSLRDEPSPFFPIEVVE